MSNRIRGKKTRKLNQFSLFHFRFIIGVYYICFRIHLGLGRSKTERGLNLILTKRRAEI